MISVIVPVYNIAPYLARCIESLEAQTVDEIQLVCTDDGSRDGSSAVLDELALNKANIIVAHKPNAGVTKARIAGIMLAQGDNIGFCDGDDEIEPDMYARLLKNKVDNNADISHCGHVVIRPDGSRSYVHNTGRFAVSGKEEALAELLAGSFEPGLCSKLYSKTLLHSLLHSGLMDYNIKINEDLLMNYYLFKQANRIVFEDVCPYHYLKREGSASTRKSPRFLTDPIKVREMILEDIAPKEGKIYNQAAASFIRISISMYMYCINHENSIDDAKVLKKKFRGNIKDKRKYIKYLNFGGRVHAYVILYTPILCKMLFRNY